jgi:hypothetical protein
MPVAASVSSRSRDAAAASGAAGLVGSVSALVAAAAGTQRAADPGTGPTGHLRENLAAEHVALDVEALRELAGVGVWPS